MFAKPVSRVSAGEDADALDARRQPTPKSAVAWLARDSKFSTVATDTVTLLDEAGVAVVCDTRPSEKGRVAVRLLVCAAHDDYSAPHGSLDHRVGMVWWSASEAKAVEVAEAARKLARELIRLRTGGWHVFADQHRNLRNHLVVSNPLSEDQKRKLHSDLYDGARKLGRLTRRAAALESSPLRRASDELHARLHAAAVLADDDVDLTGLVQARYPDADGLLLAELISAALGAHADGANPSQAVEEAPRRLSRGLAAA